MHCHCARDSQTPLVTCSHVLIDFTQLRYQDMNPEIVSYPPPPAHYSQFASGETAMQPPDIATLGPTYRMFGQVVQNPSHAENAEFPIPPIDRDVLMYDPTVAVKPQVIDLVDSLADSVMNLLNAVQNKPRESNQQLRDLDNRIKSLFHALEVLRPHEAKQVVLQLTKQEIERRDRLNQTCTETIEAAQQVLSRG